MSKDDYEKDKEDEPALSALDITKDFFDNTTAHGFNRIFAAERWYARLFWILAITVLSGYFVYAALNLLFGTFAGEGYFQYPVVTKIKIVKQQNQQFPSITVCNQNRIQKSKLAGTRFEQLPAIDNNFCACKFSLTGSNSTAAGRKKRSVNDPMDLVSMKECSHAKVDFASVDDGVRNSYKNRFRYWVGNCV